MATIAIATTKKLPDSPCKLAVVETTREQDLTFQLQMTFTVNASANLSHLPTGN